MSTVCRNNCKWTNINCKEWCTLYHLSHSSTWKSWEAGMSAYMFAMVEWLNWGIIDSISLTFQRLWSYDLTALYKSIVIIIIIIIISGAVIVIQVLFFEMLFYIFSSTISALVANKGYNLSINLWQRSHWTVHWTNGLLSLLTLTLLAQ